MTDALPRALLVDLDDTILAYSTVSEPVWADVCRRHAPGLGLDPVALHRAIRRGNAEYWSDLERHHWGRLHMDEARASIVYDALIAQGVVACAETRARAGEIAVEFDHLRAEAMHPLPGAVEALHAFRRRGTRLALVTNGAGPSQRAKIERFDLEPLFDCIVIEGEFGVGKPDARVFQHALEQLDAGLEEAWMVGDDLHRDIAGAQRLGIHAVWVDAHRQGLPAGGATRPDRVVRGVGELVGLRLA